MKRLAIVAYCLLVLIVLLGALTLANAATRVTGTIEALTLTAATANTTLVVPAGYAVRDIFVRNTTANAVTGGLRIGTTGGGADVVVSLTLGANAYTLATPLIRLFSATATQTLFIEAVVAWNGASLDITITMERAIP